MPLILIGMTTPYAPPPMETATDPVHSTADLGQRWRALMGQLGFAERLLWVVFIGPDRCMIKSLTQFPLGPRPNRRAVEAVMSSMREVLTELPAGLTVALLLTRPGRGPTSIADRRWAALLTEVGAEFDVPLEPIFRAHDESLVHIAPE